MLHPRVTTSAVLGVVLGSLLAWPQPVRAKSAPAPATRPLDAVVVTGKRRADPVADEKMAIAVTAALRADPYIVSEHVQVTVSDGVVTLEGIVFDDWDLRIALRAARRIAGARRVINDLEIKLGGE